MGHAMTWENQSNAVAMTYRARESELRLSLEVRALDNVVVVHCAGRIVYRQEATCLSDAVAEALERAQQVVLDLERVDNIDSAGLGRLVLAQLSASEQDKSLKLVGANAHLQELFDLTRLSSVLAIYPTLDEALAPDKRPAILT